MSSIPYIGLLVGGSPPHFLHSLVFCNKYSHTLLLLLLIKHYFMSVTASDHNRHAPYGIPHVLPLILLRDVVFSLFHSDSLNQPSLLWQLNPCFHQYGVVHQFMSLFLFCGASVFLVVWPGSLLLWGGYFPHQMADCFSCLPWRSP